MTYQLKTCPCCRGKAEMHSLLVRGAYYAKCSKCHLRTAEFRDRESALEEWNRREGEAQPESAGLSGFIAYDYNSIDPNRFVYFATCDRAWEDVRAWEVGWPTVIDLSKVPASAVVRRETGRVNPAENKPETEKTSSQPAGDGSSPQDQEDTPCCGENRSHAPEQDSSPRAAGEGKTADCCAVSAGRRAASESLAQHKPRLFSAMPRGLTLTTPENRQAELRKPVELPPLPINEAQP